MKHPFDLHMFFSFLQTQSIGLSDRQKNQFKRYHQLIKIRSGKQNLVSKIDVEHLVERHFLVSTFLANCLPEKITGKIIDIGSGAGFPGVVLKIIRPELSLSLLDSSHKKVLFLEEVCEQLNLDCPIIHHRSEKLKPPVSECYTIAVSRAVARLKVLWDWSAHLIVDSGNLYAFKGGNYQQELDELREAHVKYEILNPDKEWLGVSDYLKQKYIIKLEK